MTHYQAWIIGIFTLAALSMTAPWSLPLPPPDTNIQRFAALQEEYEQAYKPPQPVIKNVQDYIKKKKANELTYDELIDFNSRLSAINVDYLKPCDTRYYYQMKPSIVQKIAAHDAATSKTMPAKTSLEQAVYKYSGETFTTREILDIAENEFAEIKDELSGLERQVIESGLAVNLNDFGSRPDFFRTDVAAIQADYNALIGSAETTISGLFYDYDIPKATAHVSQKSQRWHAIASYMMGSNPRMILHFDTKQHDTKFYNFLVAHEIMPGHHLQNAAKYKMPLCPTESGSRIGQLLEGWATYAEEVANTAGFFDSYEQRLGWLDYKLVRTMRIIVDVHKTRDGWPKDRLERLWRARMPDRLQHFFERDFARLEKSGHHHMSYIFGRRAIEATRDQLRDEMGDDFDIRKFHDVLIRGYYGSMENFYDRVKAGMEIEPPSHEMTN